MHRPIHCCHRGLLTVVAALIVIAATACANDNTTTTAPTTPTPAIVTDSFSGTLTPNGAVTHPFVAQASGNVTATLVMLTPDSTLAIGLSLGTWNGTACQTVIANDKATQGTTMTGTVSNSGGLCVRLYDAAGTVTQPQSYQVDVVHP